MSNVKLGTEQYTFEDLENKYREFIAPAFKIAVDGSDLGREGMAITDLSVETTVADKSDVVRFTINNAYDPIKRDFEWFNKNVKLGSTLEVQLGYTDQLTPVFFGYVTAIDARFPREGTPQLLVTAMDLSFKMMRGRGVRNYVDIKISDIVKQIGMEYGAVSFVIDETKATCPSFLKKPDNDYQFLNELARTLSYDFFVVGKTLYFRQKNKNKTPLMTLSWGKTLMAFNVEMNLAEQVSKVVVRSWDPKEAKVTVGQATTITKLGSNSTTGADLLQKMGSGFEETLFVNAIDQQDAKTKAEAALSERAMKLVSGEGECIGLPEIRAGRYITLDGLGSRLNQPYYIVSATHTIDGDGYITQFQVEGNAV
ncbi:phage late control D family protein [Cohnella fermenti]|uniref:Phage late control D family protein n=1 Tax=Cohnella fermenti TaxID=2565925 RepID=A0A4S4BG42_9BACL|nr:contractile injection system protein, VgrG/Pvc8 family [Cohnella fermenti]THF73386.1 phage late control D family protein [Cohnella fermenti]